MSGTPAIEQTGSASGRHASLCSPPHGSRAFDCVERRRQLLPSAECYPVTITPERLLQTISSSRSPFGGDTMAKVIYIVNTSLDGYTEDRDGGIDWAS